MLIYFQRFFRERGFSFVLAVVVIGIFIIRQPGADFSRYIDWARAFRHADILALAQDGIWSPLGVPLTQWQFGTGLVYAIPGFIVSADLLAFPAITSGIGLVFFFLALRRVTRDPFVALLFFCLAFVSTPLGYYSFSQSSESLASALLSIYFYLITSNSSRSPGFYLLCGILGAFVVATRAQFGLWVAAGIPLLLSGHSGRLTNRKAPTARALASLVLFSAPIVAAVAANQIVNRWMTGSFFLSPYVFGDAGFKSVDFLHPQPLAVLFHPWHGLLSYHPFLLVPVFLLGASVIAVLRGRSGGATLLAPAIFVAFLAQLWIQSAWYCWWLGTDTFGMRAFAPAVVPVLIAAAPLFEKAMNGRPGRGLLSVGAVTGFVLLATAWSGLLLTQGPTNFTAFPSLLLGQAYGIWALLNAPSTYIAGVIAIGLLWLGLGRRGSGLASPSEGPARFAMAVVLFVLLRAVLAQEGPLALAALLASAALLAEALKRLEPWDQPKVRQGLVRVAGLLLAGTWIFSQIVFIRLAVQVESQLRPNPDGATFHVQEVFDSYREYLEVSGFEEEKRALANFLSSYRDEPRKFGFPASP